MNGDSVGAAGDRHRLEVIDGVNGGERRDIGGERGDLGGERGDPVFRRGVGAK